MTSFGGFPLSFDNFAVVSVTQATSNTTAVTANGPVVKVTMNGATIAADGSATFTVNNSHVLADSLVLPTLVTYNGDTDIRISVGSVAAGSFAVTVTNNDGSTATGATKTIVLAFQVL
mmetsp:Transcript_13285/g.33881  ORF Transcript_13285/g.33881 Transcript_13285/m.33881 type:complete len:118 (-) Transcript_13285:99-452(-)|eukprot:CAMPEP_0202045936 /NCGR_PEP_ID=MMETSP0963-20130614/1007_1 /ASSEMBLY_ACC=CAM_ASM_000494 /TAXON_ID=4773 /ORGANISM="Schizochytrium aggregatum, Strain ATCC28209" /LENGTH=117 /DNA_ID=CAMNT_0048610553 /DNA_START=51 /DNA_END=404 /DNA_ORIENTATION=+